MGKDASKRRLFQFGDGTGLSDEDGYTRRDAPRGQLSLTGPGARRADGHLPVRGDLAHIRLAGRYFVPHYAVPMPLRAGPAGAVLRAVGRADGETLATLAPGEVFNVLDIAGGWAWGQVGDDGLVGYVEQAGLEAPAP